MREGEEGKNSLPIQLVGGIGGMGTTQLGRIYEPSLGFSPLTSPSSLSFRLSSPLIIPLPSLPLPPLHIFHLFDSHPFSCLQHSPYWLDYQVNLQHSTRMPFARPLAHLPNLRYCFSSLSPPLLPSPSLLSSVVVFPSFFYNSILIFFIFNTSP